MADNNEELERFGHAVMEKATFLNAEYGLAEYTNPVWLHFSFDVTISLFKRVGLRENVKKTLTMVRQPGQIVGRQSTPNYGRQMIIKGDSHRLR